ncbi:MAG: cobalamin-binding protein [Balneolaceae bacterium]
MTVQSSPRILSLLPSGTEIICELGLEKFLVGRSHECDYPESVKRLPVCSRPNYPSGRNSMEIHESARDILKHALSIYQVDVNKIQSLRPTHILTQSQCEVCAISTSELQLALHELIREEGITVFDSNPVDLDAIYRNIRQISNALRVPDAGDRLTTRIEKRFEKIHAETNEIPVKPNVAHIEWIEPLMTGGHWMYSLIDWAGGRDCFRNTTNRWITIQDLEKHNPDKIVIAPCGFNVERTLEEIQSLAGYKEWQRLNAVQTGQVYLCDGSSYFNRPGPRLTDSLKILAEIYHPELYPKSYTDRDWIRYEPDVIK